MAKKGEVYSEEKRREMSERMRQLNAERRAIQASTPSVPVAPVATLPAQQQCVYCGNRFDEGLLAEHQRLVHKGEVPVAETVPAPSGRPPGTIIRDGKSPARKEPWTRKRIEELADAGEPDFAWEMYEPPYTELITWQGVSYKVYAGQENRIPRLFAQQMRNSIRATREAVAPKGLIQKYNGVGLPEGVVGVLEGAGMIREGV